VPGGLAERRYGPDGIVSEAGAINEGLADYFAMTVSGDPQVAEYIGRFDVASGTPYLRTGETEAVCPDDLVGDWHSDGRLVSSALWALRLRLGLVVDTIVLRTLPRLPPDALLDDFGATALQVAEDLAAEGVLDEEDLTLARRVLATRGLLDCPHVIDDPGLATTGKRLQLVAADENMVPFAPGPLQLRVRVPTDTTEVTLFVTLSAEGADTEAAASFLVKRADEPIVFSFDISESEVIEASGDHDLEIEAESLNGEDFIARLEVTPGEVLHVALANRSPTAASASNFFVAPSDPSAQEGGCGCRSQPSAPWLVAALALARRRRRK
jgi:MYXO-CTERM domain-containing protein